MKKVIYLENIHCQVYFENIVLEIYVDPISNVLYRVK